MPDPDRKVAEDFFYACALSVNTARNEYVKENGKQPNMRAVLTHDAMCILECYAPLKTIKFSEQGMHMHQELCGCPLLTVPFPGVGFMVCIL